MGLIYQLSLRIPFDMSDINAHAKLPELLAMALQVSGMQSHELGMSDKKVLEEYHLVWIVTDYEMTIQRLPQFNEKITIETEALSYNRYFCYRRFTIYGEANESLMEIIATFVLMDKDSRKVQPVLEEIVAPYHSEAIKKIKRGPKYQALQNFNQSDYQVRFHDLDMNGHVNNSRYLDWMYEALGTEFLMEHIPHKIDLKYVKEVLPEGNISSRVDLHDLVSYHEIESEGKLNAQAIIEWRKLDDTEG